MKPPTEKNKNISRKIYILIAVGFTLLVISVVMLLVDPLRLFIKHATRIEVGSPIFNMLQEEIPGAFIHVYMFNVTNSEAFLSGVEDKLKIQEVGPFVYREYRTHTDIDLDQEAGVMRYTPKIWTVFQPEESVGDPHVVNVTTPNTAFLAMASKLSNENFWTQSGYNTLVYASKSKPMVSFDVHSHLWGYEEPLITLGNTLFPGWITFDKMGLLDRLYDNRTIPRIEVGIRGGEKFQIKTLNGSPGLQVREYDNPSKRTRCNTLKDTYEGLAYPPGLTKDTSLRIYRNVFCQMIDLELVGTKKMDYSPEAFVYEFKNNTFRIDPSNECLCDTRSSECKDGVADISPCLYGTKTMEYSPEALVYESKNNTFKIDPSNECLCDTRRSECKDGVADISPCLYGLKLALSNAHFLHADSKLYERIEGIQPDEKKHGSEFIVDPKIGAVLKTSFTLQVNIDVRDVSYNLKAKPFSNMLLPLAYFKIMQTDIPEEGKEIFRTIYFRIGYIIRGIEICSFVLGIIMLAYVARHYWKILYPTKKDDCKISNNLILQTNSLLDEKTFKQIRVLDES